MRSFIQKIFVVNKSNVNEQFKIFITMLFFYTLLVFIYIQSYIIYGKFKLFLREEYVHYNCPYICFQLV